MEYGPSARRTWPKALVVVIVGALAAGGWWQRERLVALAGRPAAAAEVRVIRVFAREEPPPPPLLTATGRIVSDHRVQVNTKVSGQITALYFEQGDTVTRGQKLAEIEDVVYRARRDEAAAVVEQARANLEFQRFNYERTRGLVQTDNAASVEYADALRGVREGEARLAAAEAALAFASKALADCVVVAPISGVILERNVEVGDFVAAEGGRGANANAQFALIADMTRLRVEVDVSELDIARIRAGMPCLITPDAYKDRRYHGHVMWIDPGANYSKATVQVKVRIEEPDEFLRVEGSAQVVFLAQLPASGPSTRPAGLWIPDSACRIQPGASTGKVFVVSDGRLRETSVTVGRRSGNQLEILEGLSEGQSIAAEGVDRLADGQRVAS